MQQKNIRVLSRGTYYETRRTCCFSFPSQKAYPKLGLFPCQLKKKLGERAKSRNLS
jgi:hypothetical protein